jgi:hypothetical protein
MIRQFKTASVILICLLLAGCGNKQAKKPNPLQLQYEYDVLLKDEQGQIQATGNRSSIDTWPSLGLGSVDGMGIGDWKLTLEVTSLDDEKATFRFGNQEGKIRDFEIKLGESKDIFLEGDTYGVRMKVVKIRPYGQD